MAGIISMVGIISVAVHGLDVHFVSMNELDIPLFINSLLFSPKAYMFFRACYSYENKCISLLNACIMSVTLYLICFLCVKSRYGCRLGIGSFISLNTVQVLIFSKVSCRVLM